MIRKVFHSTYRVARRIAILVVGSTVLLFGIVLIVTPGPAFVVIPVGLAILGLEFAWARRWLRSVREQVSNHASKLRANNAEAHRDRVSDRLD